MKWKRVGWFLLIIIIVIVAGIVWNIQLKKAEKIGVCIAGFEGYLLREIEKAPKCIEYQECLVRALGGEPGVSGHSYDVSHDRYWVFNELGTDSWITNHSREELGKAGIACEQLNKECTEQIRPSYVYWAGAKETCR